MSRGMIQNEDFHLKPQPFVYYQIISNAFGNCRKRMQIIQSVGRKSNDSLQTIFKGNWTRSQRNESRQKRQESSHLQRRFWNIVSRMMRILKGTLITSITIRSSMGMWRKLRIGCGQVFKNSSKLGSTTVIGPEVMKVGFKVMIGNDQ